METISIRRGETLNLEIESDDPTAQTVNLYVGIPETGEVVLNVQATFQIIEAKANLVALLRVEANQSEAVPSGDYEYQLTVITGNGEVEKYPETSDCDDDCDLPKFIVKPALDSPEV